MTDSERSGGGDVVGDEGDAATQLLAVQPARPMVKVRKRRVSGQRLIGNQTVSMPAHVVSTANAWLEQKTDELAQAEQALSALRRLGGGHARLARVRERIRFLRHFVKAMNAGFLPIPRFDSERLDIDVEELPAEALVAMANANALRVFDEVRFVPGQVPTSRPGGHREGRTWTRRRLTARDPLVVGLIRTPEHRVAIDPRQRMEAWNTRVIPAREEMFLIAWWRPEDEADWTMF
jgi:hypothetical protein